MIGCRSTSQYLHIKSQRVYFPTTDIVSTEYSFVFKADLQEMYIYTMKHALHSRFLIDSSLLRDPRIPVNQNDVHVIQMYLHKLIRFCATVNPTGVL